MDESKRKKEYDVTTKELVRNIKEESDTKTIEYYRRQLQSDTESYDQYKKDSENRFDEASHKYLKELNMFVLNEDNCLSLKMICRKKQEMIFSIPSLKSTHTHLFRGVDYSGLSVQLNMMDVFKNSDNSLLIDFIRPDTYFGCEQLPLETSHISNTVNRNIFTRYNDQILMGFLINNCEFSCNIEYDVKVSNVRFEGDDKKLVTDDVQFIPLEIYLYEISMTVEAISVPKHEMRGYRMIISEIIMEYRTDNGDTFYTLNGNLNIAKKIQEMVQQRDEGKLDFESEHAKLYNFTVDMDKFVLDYGRQTDFFGTECPYANIYLKALNDKRIDPIGSNVTMSESVEMKVPPTGTAKHQNRTAFSSKRMQRDGLYLQEIERLAAKIFEELTAEQMKKYDEHFESLEVSEELTDSEKALKKIIHEKKIKDTTDPGPEVPVTVPESVPAEGVPAPAVSPPATGPALSSEPISAAAQPAAKKSKVSLARQQAANAPVDST